MEKGDLNILNEKGAVRLFKSFDIIFAALIELKLKRLIICGN